MISETQTEGFFPSLSAVEKFTIETSTLSIMPSPRKQMSKEKRSKQSDVMSDIGKMDVMLGSRIEFEEQQVDNELKVHRVNSTAKQY